MAIEVKASWKKKIAERFFLESLLYKIKKTIRRVKPLDNKDFSSGLVIVPCDMFSVLGSRGDEAMLVSAIQNFRETDKESPIHIFVNQGFGVEELKKASIDDKLVIQPIIGGYDWMFKVIDRIKSINISNIVILGADCMDGAYSRNLSISLLGIHAILLRLGLHSHLYGFSFNDKPEKIVNRAFKVIGKPIKFNLRDPQSLIRFKQYTKCDAKLVSDAAFSLKIDKNFEEYENVSSRIEAWKEKGIDKVLVFNYHPMIANNIMPKREECMQIVDGISDFLNRYQKVAILFLPHDDRHKISDNAMLSVIYGEIIKKYPSRVYYNKKVYRASQLKALVGLADGVISGRMHLAIAALGMKRPVLVADYQDKFQGLLMHFSVSDNYRLKGTDFYNKNVLADSLSDFYENLASLSEIVEESLSKVAELSQLNFK